MYTSIPFTRERQMIADAGWLGASRHTLHGLVEVDVTQVRRQIRQRRTQTGKQLSFTAYMLACLGQAVAEDRRVQAYRSWRNELVIFDEVDVMIMVEVQRGEGRFPQPLLVRGVNRRSWEDINDEIRSVQSSPQEHSGNKFLEVFPRLPMPLRRLSQVLMVSSPSLMKQFAGTVGMTSLGMFGGGSFWGIGLPIHNLSLTLGGISEKPVVVNGEIAVREVLCLTVSVNHDIIDGAPAARFGSRLLEIIQNC
jgi:pyruvate/2-oxoglutarate dehydrogenase complex dihydrolipoamide acyltransferase (E2) component